jgi:hypothetical protein
MSVGLSIAGALLAATPLARAQEPTVEDITRLRQNPVSGLRSVFFQNETTTINGKAADVFSVQPVWPFSLGDDWKLITYTIVPMAALPALASGSPEQGSRNGLQSLPAAAPTGNSAQGLGNILFNGFITPKTHQGSFTWGIGPAIQLPTRTNPALGSDRVSAGPALLLHDSSGPWAGTIVLQNYWSLGGSGSNKVNNFAAQYALYYNLSDGWYLASNATIAADWLAASENRWLVPVGGGIGKTFKIGGQFYSASVQGFYDAVRPSFAGTWSVIAQFQLIFSQ